MQVEPSDASSVIEVVPLGVSLQWCGMIMDWLWIPAWKPCKIYYDILRIYRQTHTNISLKNQPGHPWVNDKLLHSEKSIRPLVIFFSRSRMLCDFTILGRWGVPGIEEHRNGEHADWTNETKKTCSEQVEFFGSFSWLPPLKGFFSPQLPLDDWLLLPIDWDTRIRSKR